MPTYIHNWPWHCGVSIYLIRTSKVVNHGIVAYTYTKCWYWYRYLCIELFSFLHFLCQNSYWWKTWVELNWETFSNHVIDQNLQAAAHLCNVNIFLKLSRAAGEKKKQHISYTVTIHTSCFHVTCSLDHWIRPTQRAAFLQACLAP